MPQLSEETNGVTTMENFQQKMAKTVTEKNRNPTQLGSNQRNFFYKKRNISFISYDRIAFGGIATKTNIARYCVTAIDKSSQHNSGNLGHAQ